MPSETRYFDLQEANRAVEAIRPLMSEVQEIRDLILREQPEVWSAVRSAAGNGGNPALSQLVEHFERVRSLIKEIQRTGAIVKDIDQGLVDFPALRQGAEVCLCWKYGEPGVLFWHDMEAGFAGRQPIDEF